MIFGGSEQLMKKLITYLGVFSTVAILALPVAARNFAPPDTLTQDPCASVESKNALYQTIVKNLKDDQAKAYEDSKKYLACPAAAEVDENQQKIIAYLKRFVDKYEAADKKNRFYNTLYVDKKYPEAYALGKELLTTEPENLKVMVDLGANGYLVPPLKNPALNAEALDYAKRALAMLDSGKTIDDWKPLPSKEVAVAYLNYTIGTLSLEKEPNVALKHLIKAAQFETPLKSSPYTYAYIAGAYETGVYAKQSDDYKAMYSGKDETPESKLALANINQTVDRMIDGYARAVALATDPKIAAQKTNWNDSLTQWYKFRNNGTTDGMDQLVAGITSKPLPPEPTPIVTLPTPPATPAATPASTSGATAPQGNGAGAASAPAAAKPTAKPDRPRN
jgi:hypothetical protein